MSSNDQDFSYKLLGKRMAWALGYVPLLNVPVWLPEFASSRTGVELTDADVFGVRFAPSGRVSKILIDCKSTTGRAVDRVLWVKGLEAFLKIDELYLFKKRVPRNARWLAQQLGVSCLNENELPQLEQRLGLKRLQGAYFDGSAYERLMELLTGFPKNSEYRHVARFLSGGVWTLEPRRRVLTLLAIGHQNDFRKKLLISKPAHVALVLQGTLMLAINLGFLCARLNAVDSINLEQRLREELHGGAESLEQKLFYLDAVASLTMKTSAKQQSPSVDLEAFPNLLEQVNRLLIRRYSLNDAVRIIDVALHLVSAGLSGLPEHLGGTRTSLPAKVASDILSLFVKSNGLDHEFSTVIMSLLSEKKNAKIDTPANADMEPSTGGMQPSLLDSLAIPEDK